MHKTLAVLDALAELIARTPPPVLMALPSASAADDFAVSLFDCFAAPGGVTTCAQQRACIIASVVGR